MATLPSANSIVDYLYSRGFKPSAGEQFPLYGVREQMYNASGLSSMLGEYRGSGPQNTELLKKLSSLEGGAGVSLSPSNVFSIIQGGTAPTVPIGGGTAPGGVTPQYGITPTDQLNPASVEGTSLATGSDAIPNYITNLAQTAAGGTLPSAEEVSKGALDQFLGSTQFKFAQEEALAAKDQARISAQRETEKFINDIAARGLYYSGIRKQGVSDLEVDQLARMLDIDRSFAKIVAEGLQSSAQDLVKQAKQGQEAAISALDKLGFVWTGERLEPKPSEVRAQSAEQRADINQALAISREERAQTSEAISFERLRLSQEASERANTALSLSLQRFSNSLVLGSNQFTIRAGIAGLSKEQANDIVQLDTPPAWFATQEQNKALKSLPTNELQTRWDALKKQVKDAAAKTSDSDLTDLYIESFLNQYGLEGTE